MPSLCTDFLCSTGSQSRSEAPSEELLQQTQSATSLRCSARGSSMVLRLLLLLGGLLRATEAAPRCETGQETLGKANHLKVLLLLLFLLLEMSSVKGSKLALWHMV